MSPREVNAHCQLDSESSGYLEHAMGEMNFSARGYDRILKVARTRADRAGSVDIRKRPKIVLIDGFAPEPAFQALWRAVRCSPAMRAGGGGDGLFGGRVVRKTLDDFGQVGLGLQALGAGV